MAALRLAAAAAAAALAAGAYVQAPVTDDMRAMAAQVQATLLPPGGVTQASSVGWQKLAFITDMFGSRMSGSPALEAALDWVRDTARAEGLVVTEQPATISHWVRGAESFQLLAPRAKALHGIGLGFSAPTNGNVTAEVFVVASNDELQANCSKAAGKIVLFNTPFTTYGATVPVRGNAAVWAAACGAVGALIRSVGPWGLQTPHTGFSTAGTIAAAALSWEDAAQLQRMFDRSLAGIAPAPVVSMSMASQLLPPITSRNLLIDLVGASKPDEYVVVSGHMDSWDVGEGAMDDGGGAVGAWEAVRVLNALGAKPARTIRAVMWVEEECGTGGGNAYAAAFGTNGNNALANHSWLMETDIGAFTPWGIGLSCSANSNGGCGAAKAQLATIGAALLAGIGSGNVTDGGEGTDIEPSCAYGVPCSGLNVLDVRLTNDDNNFGTVDAMGMWAAPPYATSRDPVSGDLIVPYDSAYFNFHHTPADTVERISPRQLNHVSAALATWAYAIAQLPALLPRDEPAPPAAQTNNGGRFSAPAIAAGVVVPLLLVGAGLLAWRRRGAISSWLRGRGVGRPGASSYTAMAPLAPSGSTYI